MLQNIFKILTAKLWPWVPAGAPGTRGFPRVQREFSVADGRHIFGLRPKMCQNYLRPSQWELSCGRERWGKLFLLSSVQLRFARLLAPCSFSRAGSCYNSSSFFFWYYFKVNLKKHIGIKETYEIMILWTSTITVCRYGSFLMASRWKRIATWKVWAHIFKLLCL